MFVQIVQGKVDDEALFTRQGERWPAELKAGATGYLGSTWGRGADGTGIILARFESEAAARANSERPEQGAWWAETEKAFSDVSFHDCAEVDTLMGGGSHQAGFVQVIQGRAKDQDAARAMLRDAEGQLAESRPDILGGVMAWHGDGGSFTQVMYFRSESEAHAGEQSMSDQAVDQQYREMMAVEPTFIDLADPHFD